MRVTCTGRLPTFPANGIYGPYHVFAGVRGIVAHDNIPGRCA